MNKALQQIFWGYVFIFFRIHIGIDLFADPIGLSPAFFRMFQARWCLSVAKKAKIVGLVGVFVSLPSVVVNLSEAALPFGWSTYTSLLFILKMIMGYYLFVVLKDVAKVFGDRALQQRTESTFKFYVAIHLFAFALLSFSMNISENGVVILSLFSDRVLVMDILFLLLVGAIRRVTLIIFG